MRKIKYRAWNKITKTMDYDVDISGYELPYKLEDFFNDKDLIFMQYTGFKDKNGVEICEGDIIITKYNNFPSVVKYIKTPSFCGLTSDQYYIDENCIVIGNKFDNSELLEPEK